MCVANYVIVFDSQDALKTATYPSSVNSQSRVKPGSSPRVPAMSEAGAIPDLPRTWPVRRVLADSGSSEVVNNLGNTQHMGSGL